MTDALVNFLQTGAGMSTFVGVFIVLYVVSLFANSGGKD